MGKVQKKNNKAEWIEDVNALIGQISKWGSQENWIVSQGMKTISEEALGDYQLPELHLRLPGGHLVVEPIAKTVMGADGRIDIYAFPALNRMFLILKRDQWRLKTDSGVNWPKPWNKKTFLELAQLLTSPI